MCKLVARSMLQCCKMKEQTQGTICIEHRVRFAETTGCLWMFVVPGAIARIMPINSIFFQAGSTLDLLSLWSLEKMLSRIIGHIQMARRNRYLLAINGKTAYNKHRRHSEIEFVPVRYLTFDSGELDYGAWK